MSLTWIAIRALLDLGGEPPSSAVRTKAFSSTSSGNLPPSVRAFTLRLKFSLALRW
uniref:Uncharacterized protein n=1 Tax=Crocodylus porosus TaxID=8502 RepID=A0A7M4E3F7_CROPO